MFKVVKGFTDLHDANHEYQVGDTYPRSGIKVSEERLAELAGSGNKQGAPLIEEAKKSAPKKKVGDKTSEE